MRNQPGYARRRNMDEPAAPRLPMALMTWVFVALVLVIVVVLVLVKLIVGGAAPSATGRGDQAPAAVVQAVTTLAPTTYDAAAPTTLPADMRLLVPPQPLTDGSTPVVDFVGAQYSPYSAAASWAVATALARFGAFGHLGQTTSSQDMVFPRTPGLSFDGASYHSPVVDLRATEEYADTENEHVPGGYRPLDSLSAADAALVSRDDVAGGSIPAATLPFVDVAGRLLVVGDGIGYSPGLFAQLSISQVADSLSDPTSSLGRAVLGLADEITAAICAADGKAPSAVCRSPGVQAAAVAVGLG